MNDKIGGDKKCYQKKKFNGKIYVLHGGFYKKSVAKQVAGSIREEGDKARIIKSGDAWYVYERSRFMK